MELLVLVITSYRQFSTFAILILAANTAFADSPRRTSILAQDGFRPAQLTNRAP